MLWAGVSGAERPVWLVGSGVGWGMGRGKGESARRAGQTVWATGGVHAPARLPRTPPPPRRPLPVAPRGTGGSASRPLHPPPLSPKRLAGGGGAARGEHARLPGVWESVWGWGEEEARSGGGSRRLPTVSGVSPRCAPAAALPPPPSVPPPVSIRGGVEGEGDGGGWVAVATVGGWRLVAAAAAAAWRFPSSPHTTRVYTCRGPTAGCAPSIGRAE